MSITPSTPYISGSEKKNLVIKQQPKSNVNMMSRKYLIGIKDIDFEAEHAKIDSIMSILLTKNERKPAKIQLKFSETKKIQVLDSFSEQGPNYTTIGKSLNLSRQNVRNVCLKHEKDGGVFKTIRGRTRKLTGEHIKFLIDLIDDPKNLGMTLSDMRNQLITQFAFQTSEISISTIQRALKREKKTFKKIVWKKPKDNEPRTKNLRKIVAIDLLKIFMEDFSPISIDESSFNLCLRPTHAWGTAGKIISGKRPAKSCNYSLLAAMDINEIIGWMLFKGSVKKGDFFTFLMELVKNNDRSRCKTEKPIFFMDNASIHKSKLYMTGNFNKNYTTLYNAPYTPQLNPIENCFSKIKSYVKKSHVKTEKQLIEAIDTSIKNVTPKDCFGYVGQMFKNLLPAFHKKDFF